MIFSASYAFLAVVQWEPWIGDWGWFSRFLAAIMMLISFFWFVGKLQTKKNVSTVLDVERLLDETLKNEPIEEVEEWLKQQLKYLDKKNKFNPKK